MSSAAARTSSSSASRATHRPAPRPSTPAAVAAVPAAGAAAAAAAPEAAAIGKPRAQPRVRALRRAAAPGKTAGAEAGRRPSPAGDSNLFLQAVEAAAAAAQQPQAPAAVATRRPAAATAPKTPVAPDGRAGRRRRAGGAGRRRRSIPPSSARTARAATPDAEAQALLQNKNVVLDDVGVSDIKAGRIDPRIVAVLTKLSHEHKIVVSCMCSDHPRLTTGGSVSNHTFGRGLDIASIDGEIVSPGSALAREVASELSQFDPALRPDEIGSPFAINGPGYFTDAAHQNHIHVGFKTAITPDFKLPGDVRRAPRRRRRRQRSRPSAPPVAAAAAPRPAVAAPKREPEAARPGLFGALPEQGAGAASAGDAKAGRDSNLFLQAVEAEKATATAATRRGRPAAPRRPARSTSPACRPPTPATTRRRTRSPPGWPRGREARPARRSCR